MSDIASLGLETTAEERAAALESVGRARRSGLWEVAPATFAERLIRDFDKLAAEVTRAEARANEATAALAALRERVKAEIKSIDEVVAWHVSGDSQRRMSGIAGRLQHALAEPAMLNAAPDEPAKGGC